MRIASYPYMKGPISYLKGLGGLGWPLRLLVENPMTIDELRPGDPVCLRKILGGTTGTGTVIAVKPCSWATVLWAVDPDHIEERAWF